MNQHAIDQYFRTVAFTSFEGSLQSLAQIISRHTGGLVTSHDLMEYFLLKKDSYNCSINICFSNGKTTVSIRSV